MNVGSVNSPLATAWSYPWSTKAVAPTRAIKRLNDLPRTVINGFAIIFCSLRATFYQMSTYVED
jgi:hypothetical protein